MYEPVEKQDPTIALVLEGGMYYDVEYEDDNWIRMHLERGDLIIIPKQKCHRCTTTSKVPLFLFKVSLFFLFLYF